MARLVQQVHTEQFSERGERDAALDAGVSVSLDLEPLNMDEIAFPLPYWLIQSVSSYMHKNGLGEMIPVLRFVVSRSHTEDLVDCAEFDKTAASVLENLRTNDGRYVYLKVTGKSSYSSILLRGRELLRVLEESGILAELDALEEDDA